MWNCSQRILDTTNNSFDSLMCSFCPLWFFGFVSKVGYTIFFNLVFEIVLTMFCLRIRYAVIRVVQAMWMATVSSQVCDRLLRVTNTNHANLLPWEVKSLMSLCIRKKFFLIPWQCVFDQIFLNGSDTYVVKICTKKIWVECFLQRGYFGHFAEFDNREWPKWSGWGSM